MKINCDRSGEWKDREGREFDPSESEVPWKNSLNDVVFLLQ
jgi:hypothetical protein